MPKAIIDCLNIHSSPLMGLFNESLSGFVLSVTEDHRPLVGWTAQVDWHFRREISRYIKLGFIQGYTEECTYLPVWVDQKRFDFFLLGLGNKQIGYQISEKQCQFLIQNLNSCGFSKIGIYCPDFPGLDWKYLNQSLKKPLLVFQ